MKIFDKIKNWNQPRLYWRNIFRYYLDQMIDQKASVEIIQPELDKSVLVLCPHIDDDVIGLGGTLYRYHLSGAQVTVVYFSSENQCRKEEGKKISGYLGYHKALFFDYPPEHLSDYPKVQDDIQNLLNNNSFDVIYVPFHLDRHKDHIALGIHLAKVLQKNPGLNSVIRSYEVWSPLFPNQIVDISKVVEYKKNGILICESQMESVNYVDLALSLNRYRGITSTRANKMEFAEAFYSSTPHAYLKLLLSK